MKQFILYRLENGFVANGEGFFRNADAGLGVVELIHFPSDLGERLRREMLSEAVGLK